MAYRPWRSSFSSSIVHNLLYYYLYYLTITLLVVKAQTNFNDDNYATNIRISTCCELNLKSPNGGNGRSCDDGNSNYLKNELVDSTSKGGGSKGERQTRAINDEWIVPAHLTSTNETTIFFLQNNRPLCTSGDVVRSFSTNNISQPLFQMVPENGWIGIGPSKFQMDYFNVNQYCVNGLQEDSVEIRTCNPPCTPAEPCIHKCCPLKTVFSPFDVNSTDRNCLPTSGTTEWGPLYFKSIQDPTSLLSADETAKKRPFYSVLHPRFFSHLCIDGAVGMSTSQEVADSLSGLLEYLNFRMSEDGKLWHRNEFRNWVTIDDATVCTDGIQDYVFNETHPYQNSISEQIIFTCPIDLPEVRQVNNYYGILAILCSFFALLTVIVYSLLWEKQSVHGWTIMTYSSVVFFLFIFLGTSHLTTMHNEELRETVICKLIATISHFLFIAMFSWLTMISLDLWLTFRTITVTSGRSKGLKRYLLYCILGFGIPTFMICLGWGLEASLADDENSTTKVPFYGRHVCYVSPHFLWEYVYGLCTILFGFNILFFVITTWKLIEYKRSTRMATKSTPNRQSYMLFVKLFFLVGILWIFELISFAVSGTHVSWWWQVMDTLNCLQPVAIFLIFVLKYDIISSLGEKYGCMKGCLAPILSLLEMLESKQKRAEISKPTTKDESVALNSMSKTANTHLSMSDSEEPSSKM